MTSGASPARPPEPAAPAEDVLVARFWERIRVFAARRLGDVSAAEDVAQETIRRVVDALRAGRVQDLEALPGFVFQTARHVCQQRHRSHGRETRAMERLGASLEEASDEPDALSSLVSAERAAAVRGALASLADADRALLQSLFYEGVDPAELAATLGVSAGALRVRKHRAIARLAELLGEPAE